ncbi:HNH endonuclease [Bacillus phage DZ1]|uniref:HNH endonuclease n=1 Tax=Bacillus phage DZ1 TaxID=3075862 RepID=A0AA96EKV9_9CAUD|nr:HNH endonuclease [Bacillus phage DZ1]
MILQVTGGQIIVDDDFAYEKAIRIGNHGYATINVNRRPVLLHRWLMGVTERHVIVDHINGNKLDNRKENLRVANKSQNAGNRKAKGYYWCPRLEKYYAQLNKQYLGHFDTEKEAQQAYQQAHKAHFGEFSPY